MTPAFQFLTLTLIFLQQICNISSLSCSAGEGIREYTEKSTGKCTNFVTDDSECLALRYKILGPLKKRLSLDIEWQDDDLPRGCIVKRNTATNEAESIGKNKGTNIDCGVTATGNGKYNCICKQPQCVECPVDSYSTGGDTISTTTNM